MFHEIVCLIPCYYWDVCSAIESASFFSMHCIDYSCIPHTVLDNPYFNFVMCTNPFWTFSGFKNVKIHHLMKLHLLKPKAEFRSDQNQWEHGNYLIKRKLLHLLKYNRQIMISNTKWQRRNKVTQKIPWFLANTVSTTCFSLMGGGLTVH